MGKSGGVRPGAGWQKRAALLAATVALVLSGLIFQNRVSALMEADMEEKLLEITAQVGQSVDQRLDSFYAALHTAAKLLEEGGALEGPALSSLMGHIKDSGPFLTVGAVGLDGRGIYGPGMGKENLGLLREALRGHDTARWLHASPVGGPGGVFLSVPLYRGKHIAGAVYALFDSAQIPGLNSPDVFGGRGLFLLLDAGFQSVLPVQEPPPQGELADENTRALGRLKQKLYRQRRGVERFYGPQGEVYAACVPLKSIPGWYAACAIPAQLVIHRVMRVILLMSLSIVGLCFVLLAVLWFTGHERGRRRRQINNLCQLDGDTGLLNWEGLRQRAPQLLGGGEAHALAVLDFAPAPGWAEASAGPWRVLAKALEAAALAQELVCRVGPGRFALLLRADADAALAGRLGALMGAVAGSLCPPAEGAAGVVRHLAGAEGLQEAFQQCTLALGTLEETGAGGVAFYGEALSQRRRRQRELEAGLTRALAEHEFAVYLQPVAALKGLRVCGAEALARWIHPAHGLLAPAEFVPLLDKSGALPRLDFYMLRAVCALLRDWRRQGLGGFPVSVNVGAGLLDTPGLVGELEAIVQSYGTAPSQIWLEVKEGALAGKGRRHLPVLCQLRRAGFRVLIDDFGAGGLSLIQLPGLPADGVKLHQGLLGPEGAEGQGGFWQDLAALARHRDLVLLQKGVESAGQARQLLQAGCPMAQGFFVSPPMPALEMQPLLCRPPAVDPPGEGRRGTGEGGAQ